MEREKRSYWIGIVVVTAIFLSSMGTIVAAEKVSQYELVQECYNKFIAQEKADNDAWCYPDWKSYKFCAYSGCLDDIVMDRWQCRPCYETEMVYVPGYIDCVDRALDNHLECLKKANEKQRSISKNEGKFEPSFKQWRIDRVTECRKEVHPQIRICKESACRDYCIDQGAPGGKLAGSTCYGACKCDEIPKEINKPPVAHASVVSESRPELEPSSHITIEYGETVIFSAAESYDPDGEILNYRWFWDSTKMAAGEVTQGRSFPVGEKVVTLEVQDNKGAKSTDTVVVTVTEKKKGKLLISKLCTSKAEYDIGEEVGVFYNIKNVGTVDVDEYLVEYSILDPDGKTVYEHKGNVHSIATGKEQEWQSTGKWQIPSTTRNGEYTIEVLLGWWYLGSDRKVVSFTVTETTVKEATKPPAVSTTSIEETIEEGPAKEYPLSNAERNSNSRAREGIDLIAIQTAALKDVGATDIHIAKFVNREVADRIAATNNFFKNPLTTTVHEIADFINYTNTDIDKWRGFSLMSYDTTAIWAWNNRVGRCEEFGCTVYYILKTAGIQCEICSGTNDKHQFVVMNVDKAMIDEKTGYLKDSRKWPENALVIDAWQRKVLTGDEAYKNKHVMDEGKVRIVVQTSRFTPKNKDGPTDINDRNLVWDTKNELLNCRDGYERAYYAGAPLDYCRRIHE
jgi:hypothetical protein